MRQIDFVEHQPGVVAGGVGLWRRGAELDGRIEQTIDKIRARQPECWLGESAKIVAGEHDDANRATISEQFQRMSHIGRGEQIGPLAVFDASAQDARRPEIRRHRDTGCTRVARADLADDLAQAAGGEHMQTRRVRPVDQYGKAGRGEQQPVEPHYSAPACQTAGSTSAA